MATAKPSPISIPLTAPMDIIAFARLASNLSKTGSPTPVGIPATTHSMIPPTESISAIFSLSISPASLAALLSGIYIYRYVTDRFRISHNGNIK